MRSSEPILAVIYLESSMSRVKVDVRAHLNCRGLQSSKADRLPENTRTKGELVNNILLTSNPAISTVSPITLRNITRGRGPS